MKALKTTLLIVSLSQWAIFALANDSPLSVTNPTRAFGYTIGDILEQTINLQEGETTHTVQVLPDTQREGRWITRQSVVEDADDQQLIIRYQIINSPPDVRLVSLPALSLSTADGSIIDVPEWSFSLAPLTPTSRVSESSLPLVQADWTPDVSPPTALWRNIKWLSAALLSLLLLWLIWWWVRGMREASTLPFAHAYRTIRRLKTSSSNDDSSHWLALHRAFDQMAGRSVNRGSINALTHTTDWLKPFESDIRTFYDLSSERFFANDKPHISFDLAGFSKRLYKAEKQHTHKLPSQALSLQEMS